MISHTTTNNIACAIATVIQNKINQAPLEDKETLVQRLLYTPTTSICPSPYSVSSHMDNFDDYNFESQDTQQKHIFDLVLKKYGPIANEFSQNVNSNLLTHTSSNYHQSSPLYQKQYLSNYLEIDGEDTVDDDAYVEEDLFGQSLEQQHDFIGTPGQQDDNQVMNYEYLYNNKGQDEYYDNISNWDYHIIARIVNAIFQRLDLAWDFSLDIKLLLWQFFLQLFSSTSSSSSNQASPSLSDPSSIALTPPILDMNDPSSVASSRSYIFNGASIDSTEFFDYT